MCCIYLKRLAKITIIKLLINLTFFLCVQKQELVQVETYLRSEGVLVRFWYPLDLLERPNAGYRRNTLTGLANLDISNIHIHR